jgi:ADP-heptose:LPS heptosyltransferase
VIKTSALGDVVHALPVLHALRAIYPDADMAWAVEPRFAGLLPPAPWLDRVILFRKTGLREAGIPGKLGLLRDLRRELRDFAPELVLDLQGLLKSALIGVLSGCRDRIGYCEMREGSRLFACAVKGPNASGHVIERYRDVARALGPVPAEARFPLPDPAPAREALRGELASRFAGWPRRASPAAPPDGSRGGSPGLPPDRPPLAVLFPGAGWASTLWPAASYAALAGLLRSAGLRVALGGGPADRHLAADIRRLADPPPPPDLTGRTDIGRLAGLVSLASLCVGADTGPLHLAAALGTPAVSLFGPSSGERAGTWGPKARYVSAGAPCSPCFKRTCPAKEFVCMERISPEKVFAACLEVLGADPPVAPRAPGAGADPGTPQAG